MIKSYSFLLIYLYFSFYKLCPQNMFDSAGNSKILLAPFYGTISNRYPIKKLILSCMLCVEDAQIAVPLSRKRHSR